MPHLLHSQKTSRVPRRFVFIDTESHRATRDGIETQTWRCGVVSEVHWQSKEHQWSEPVTTDHLDPGTFWQTITRAARENARTVVVAHNLSYDLRISDALAQLDALGWDIDRITMSQGHVGFDATRGKLRLILVDSLTVLPKSNDELAKVLNLTKPKLPAERDSDETFLVRCRSDVRITMTAYLTVVDALRLGDLGCWGRSGSGIAWNTMLRRHLSDKVFVHENDAVREIEHQAAYGGRAEAWQWGKLRKGRWTEWDFELAYANVLADESLPAYLYDEVASPSLSHIRNTMGKWRHLVDATVTLEAPVLPWRDEKGVVYPVGTFRGTWWDVELLTASDEGAQITIHNALRYKGAKWLETWAHWVIDLVDDKSTPEAVVLGIAAKHWQRSLVGRSSMRYRGWEEQGDAFIHGVSYMPLADLDSGEFGACLQINGRRWEAWGRQWWDSALPQLLSAVIAHCRVNLWRAMRVAGLAHVVYVDTDALIVDAEGSQRVRKAVAAGHLGSLREKSTMTRMDIWAPRYVVAPGYTRIAGVSRGRRRIAEHVYEGQTWERFGESLQSDGGRSVRIRPVVATLDGIDWHRRHLLGGLTEAYVVADGERVAPSPEAATG